MEYIFLTAEEILLIHQDQIWRYGGDAAIRDINLLNSALNIPMQSFGSELVHTTIFEMAGAYLFHIVNNHPFVDGNKRTGAATALQFLKLNGIICTVTPQELANFVLSVAKSETTKQDVADFFKNNHKRF